MSCISAAAIFMSGSLLIVYLPDSSANSPFTAFMAATSVWMSFSEFISASCSFANSSFVKPSSSMIWFSALVSPLPLGASP